MGSWEVGERIRSRMRRKSKMKTSKKKRLFLKESKETCFCELGGKDRKGF
jgi:hypothetical protein